MFSRARRDSRAQAKQKPSISQDKLPVSPLQSSMRSDSPVTLPSPRLPFNDNRPVSADGYNARKSSLGPPKLGVPRIGSNQDLSGDGSLGLDFTQSIPSLHDDATKVALRVGGKVNHGIQEPLKQDQLPSTKSSINGRADSQPVDLDIHSLLAQPVKNDHATMQNTTATTKQPRKIPSRIATGTQPTQSKAVSMVDAERQSPEIMRFSDFETQSSKIKTFSNTEKQPLRPKTSPESISGPYSLQSETSPESISGPYSLQSKTLPQSTPGPYSLQPKNLPDSTSRPYFPQTKTSQEGAATSLPSSRPLHQINTDAQSLASRKPTITLYDDSDSSSVTSRLRGQRSLEHFSRPRSNASPVPSSPRRDQFGLQTASSASSLRPDRLPLRDNDSNHVTTSWITQDPMFPRAKSASPLVPRFAQSGESIASRDSIDARSDVQRKRKSRKVGRAVTGPTMVINTQSSSEELPSASYLSSNTDSPKMEASMFPSKPQQAEYTPVMDRNFIDSRDRPYTQAKKLSDSPVTPNFARPNFQATYNQERPVTAASRSSEKPSSLSKPSEQAGTVPEKSSKSTAPSSVIGISFESTSAAFPAPQLVATRPKIEGGVSTIAGVLVPTHHTSSIRPQDSSSKSDRRRTFLNPIALLGRRKSTAESISAEAEDRKALILAQQRQKAVASGLDRLPEDQDFRIKGKIVHDFSAPRTRLDFSSPVSPEQAPEDRFSNIPEPKSMVHGLMSPQARKSITRKSVHTPVFLEHLDQSTQGGIAAESRENKDFLARYSQQSAISSYSQESAVLPPFARRSQNMEQQAPTWRDDDGSWSSGRDSGGLSSTGPPGDRESGISSFSAISPITYSSDSVQHPGKDFMNSLSPTSTDLDRSISMERKRPRSQSEATARPEASTDEQITPSTSVAHATSSSQKSSSSTSNKSPQSIRTSTPKRSVEVSKSKSNASRFSFQMGANDSEEKALEEKFRGSGVLPKKGASTRTADEDDDDYFDEDAMDDMDEMELQQQHPPVLPFQQYVQQLPPQQLVIPSQPHSASASTPTSAVERSKSSLDFFYNGDIPYVQNERELTYAEHPVFQTHSALADSRRGSEQSAILDSYLSDSPSSPQRRDEPSRKSSLTNTSPSGRGSRQGSTHSMRSSSAHRHGTMSPLPEQTETSTPEQSKTPAASEDQPSFVDSAFSSFKLGESQKVANRTRADSDTEVKPQWSRTASLWKQLKVEEIPTPIRPATIEPALSTAVTPISPSNSNSSPASYPQPRTASRQHDPSVRGAYFKGVRVRKPTGSTRQSRLSMASSRLASIRQNDEDIYFDDGQFDQDTRIPAASQTDEDTLDELPVPKRYEQERAALGVIGAKHDTTTVDVSQDAPPQQHLQAYHQALADAANRAAYEGRFQRKMGEAMVDSSTGLQPADTNIADSVTPSKMAFDFGFDAPSEEDYEAEDDIVAAANAEALAYDTDGFYGSEFGFYAHARPGAGTEVEAIHGGYFGEDGDDGLTRKRSIKEPNLTPITERSEFSTRNSFVNLGVLANGSSSTLSTPALSRMPVNAFSEHDITTLEQLKALRKNAFGGSNTSIGSQQRSSPTSQHFPSSVAMASTGSSSSGDRFTSHESPLESSHSRTGSGNDIVTYIREQENGQPRWIMERRRTSVLGQVEVIREVVADGCV